MTLRLPTASSADEALAQLRACLQPVDSARRSAKSGSSPTTKITGATILQAVVSYPPVSGNNAVRHAGRSHRRVPAAKAYRVRVAAEVRSQGLCVNLGGPLVVEFQLFPPDRRARDEDNAMKEIKDALTHAGVWVDDSNQVIVKGSWEWGAPVKGGEVIVTIRGYEP